MTTKTTAMLGAAVLLLAALANGFAGDDTFAMARAKDLPGKRVSGACLPFARELYSRLTQAQGEAHLIVFDWRSASSSGTHAIVVYRDKDGRFWAMDNLQNYPIWLAGSTPQAWAEFFAPRFDVLVKAHKTDPALAGRYADRSVAQRSAGSATLLAQK